MNSRRILLPLLCIAAGVLAGYLVWHVAPAYFTSTPVPGSIEYLRAESAGLNRQLPAKLDEKTELTITEAAPGMFTYKYRLVDIAADRVNHQNFAARAKPVLIQNACGRTETRDEFLKNGVTLRYSYFDKDQKHIATLDVTPADCGF
jgi:hypothetical protein